MSQILQGYLEKEDLLEDHIKQNVAKHPASPLFIRKQKQN